MVHLMLYCLNGYLCIFVLKQAWNFLKILIKQCPVKSINLDFPSHTKNENVNPTIMYVTFWFNSFIVSEKSILSFSQMGLNVNTKSCNDTHLGFPIDKKKMPHILQRTIQETFKAMFVANGFWLKSHFEIFFKIDTNVQLGQCWHLSLIFNGLNAKNKNFVKQSYFIHVMFGSIKSF